MAKTVYEIITEQIIAQLESGVAPWRKPWASVGGVAPQNLVSKKAYRGINIFLLASRGFASPYWLTFKQAQALGGSVKKGEKGTPVVFWKFDSKITGKDADGDDIEKTSVLLRYYTVFNSSQCENVAVPEAPKADATVEPFVPIDHCEAIVRGMPQAPPIIEATAAFYRPSADEVGIPPAPKFDSPEAYYSTLFHELTHSTGHTSRLNRNEVMKSVVFGSNDYSKEELVAEMGASFLAGVAGIENVTLNNSAAYLKHWIEVLKGDSRLVVFAASAAQKAADFILNIKPQTEAEKGAE